MTTPIRFAGLAPSRWPNGAGRKADIATGPGWLVAYAWLDGDAPFSDYTGQDRTITLLEGDGFTLHFPPPAPPLEVAAPQVPTPFDGGLPAQCRLRGGPCVVLNAMTRRDAWRHRVTVMPAPATLPAVPGERFLVVLHGSCAIAGHDPAGPRDAIRASGAVTLDTAPGTILAVMQILPSAG